MTIRIRVLSAFLCFSFALWPGSGSAAGTPAGSGRFTSKDVTFEILGAYAFHGPIGIGDDKGIVVAVGDGEFAASIIDEFYDRRTFFSDLFREHPGAFFQFTDKGTYYGLSYYMGPGNGCGFCKDNIESTVKLQNGKLVGSLKWKDKSRGFNVQLDVPVATDDFGVKQGAGGGAPGTAYLAYHDALTKKDVAKLKKSMAKDHNETWAGAEKANDASGYMAYLAKSHPTAITVTNRFVKGDHGILLLTGENKDGKITGEVRMRKEDGTWRFLQERIQPQLE